MVFIYLSEKTEKLMTPSLRPPTVSLIGRRLKLPDCCCEEGLNSETGGNSGGTEHQNNFMVLADAQQTGLNVGEASRFGTK